MGAEKRKKTYPILFHLSGISSLPMARAVLSVLLPAMHGFKAA